jgi:hypothetical protein
MHFTREELSDDKTITIDGREIPLGYIRKIALRWQQLLIAWRPYPFGRRGYFYRPNCAAEILKSLRYLRGLLSKH